LTDDASIETSSEGATSQKVIAADQASIGIKAAGAAASLRGEDRTEATNSGRQRQSEPFRRSKVDFLRRHVMDYQAIFTDMARVSGGVHFFFSTTSTTSAETSSPSFLITCIQSRRETICG
jgi:hypothetical protein